MKKTKKTKTITEPEAQTKIPRTFLAITLCLFILGIGTLAFGDTPTPVDVPAVGTGVIDGIKNAEEAVANSPGWIAVIFVAVMEFAMRLWRTSKPLSLLIFAKDFLVALGALFAALSKFLDGVLQRTKDSAPPAEEKKKAS